MERHRDVTSMHGKAWQGFGRQQQRQKIEADDVIGELFC